MIIHTHSFITVSNVMFMFMFIHRSQPVGFYSRLWNWVVMLLKLNKGIDEPISNPCIIEQHISQSIRVGVTT